MDRREFTKSAGIALAGLVAGFSLSGGPRTTAASIDTEELSISDDSSTTVVSVIYAFGIASFLRGFDII